MLTTDFALERITVKSRAGGRAGGHAGAERGIHFFIVDAPAEAFKPLAAAVRGRDVLLFNATAPDDSLRRESLRARDRAHAAEPRHDVMDALMQHLVSRKWRDILVLQGPLPADAS